LTSAKLKAESQKQRRVTMLTQDKPKKKDKGPADDKKKADDKK